MNTIVIFKGIRVVTKLGTLKRGVKEKRYFACNIIRINILGRNGC